MIPRAALTLAAALALSGNAAAADAPAPAAHDGAAAPLDELSRDLLAGSGYEIRDDGKVWDKIAEAPVSSREMPYLISRLASARRLKALIELRLLLSKAGGDKSLTPEEREAARAILRRSWAVLGLSARRDFRSYFTPEELESLDKVPLRFEQAGLEPLREPPPLPVTAEPPPAQEAPSEPVPPASGAAAIAGPAVAVPATPPTPALGTLQPWTPPPAEPAPAADAPAAADLKPAEAPAPAQPPAPPAPEPPKPLAIPAVGAEEYDAFTATGPHTDQSRELLRMIGQDAPDFCLPLLRRAVVGGVAQVVLDGERTGRNLRAGRTEDAARPDAPLVVALSPGPVFVERRKGLFGREVVILPESPEAWAALGAPRPALQALVPGAAPERVEAGPWGATQVYADGSRRGAYSAPEQAGELLEQLLLAGLGRESLDASAYAARRWALTAKRLFWSRLKEKLQRDDFLDPDRRAELAEWAARPDESDDALAAAWSAARAWVLDPRRGAPEAERLAEDAARGADCARAALEDGLAAAARRRAARAGALKALEDAGLLEPAAAQAAASAAADAEARERVRLLSAPACPPADPGRRQALGRSSALLAEAIRAERTWRSRQVRGGPRAR
ncbi:MAG: hypothetical protein HY552_06395 [Elusimicrobia bacterium]|nr:hypothetical protein [Elusimicrobiota bacterium]